MNVIITGASRGLGKALAHKFGSAGYDLWLTSVSETRLYKAMEELMTYYPDINIKAKAADLSVKEETLQFAEWINVNCPSVDILINNAGTFHPGSVHNEEDGVLESMINTNLYSAYHLTRALIPKMMKQKSGHIFNMCSIASLQAYPNGGAYSISKFALLGFSKNLREEMKPYGIKVTSVLPGAAYTSSWENSGVKKDRLMEAGDVAQMIFSCAQLSPSACVEEIVLRPQLGDL